MLWLPFPVNRQKQCLPVEIRKSAANGGPSFERLALLSKPNLLIPCLGGCSHVNSSTRFKKRSPYNVLLIHELHAVFNMKLSYMVINWRIFAIMWFELEALYISLAVWVLIHSHKAWVWFAFYVINTPLKFTRYTWIIRLCMPLRRLVK